MLEMLSGHSSHTGAAPGRVASAGVGVLRAHDHRMGLAWHVHVVEVATGATQESDVLDTLDALTDAVLPHREISFTAEAGRPAPRTPRGPRRARRPAGP